MTLTEKIAVIGRENAIDPKDAFGKYLLLDNILKSMGEEKANEFMKDTLSILEDEICNLFDKEIGEELTDSEKLMNELDDMGDIKYQLSKDEPDHYELKEDVA